MEKPSSLANRALKYLAPDGVLLRTEKMLGMLAGVLSDGIQNDNGYVVAITGQNGIGKSVLGIKLSQKTHKRLGMTFNLETNVIYVPDVDILKNKLADPDYQGQCISVDEAIKIANSRRFMNRKQVFLNELFATLQRKTRTIVIMCIPNFTFLDKYFREEKCELWFHVIARGVAVVFARSTNPLAKDSWDTDENQKIWRKCTRSSRGILSVSEQLKIYRKFSNFFTAFKFSDLDADTKAKYQSLVAKHQHLFARVSKDDLLSARTRKYRNALLECLYHFKLDGISNIDIARKIKLDVNSVNYLVRRMKLVKKLPDMRRVSSAVKPPVVQAQPT